MVFARNLSVLRRLSVCSLFAVTFGILMFGVGVDAEPARVYGVDVSIEPIPDGTPVRVFHSVEQAPAGSIAATDLPTDAPVTVYRARDAVAASYSVFTNQQASGAFIADDMTLSADYMGSGLITGYEAKVYRSSFDPGGVVDLADIQIELWDGDPLALLDTIGYANAPIPGKQSTVTGIPTNHIAVLRATLSAPVALSNPENRVWMVMTSNACRLGWLISFVTPDPGSMGPFDGYEMATDVDGGTNGAGTCCGDGSTCDVEGPAGPCAGDPDGSLGFCSDGEAETAALYTFGGSCGRNPSTSYCSTFVASVFAQGKTPMVMTVIGNGPLGELDSGVSIVDNEILLPAGDTTVFMEGRVGDWDPDDVGVKIDTFYFRSTSEDLDSNMQGRLQPYLAPCETREDCVPLVGGYCAVSGLVCRSDADCPPTPGDTCEPGEGNHCSGSVGSPGECWPVFISPERADYIFPGAGLALTGIDYALNELALSTVTALIGHYDDPEPFPAEGLYAGTVAFYVPPDAVGTFTIELDPVSGLLDHPVGSDTVKIPLVGLGSPKISVGVGACCSDLVHVPSCIDGVTEEMCNQMPGPRLFSMAKKCSQVADACATAPDRIRYLSIRAGDPGQSQAIRVTMTNLPAPYGVYNGRSLWLGAPSESSENGGSNVPISGFGTYYAATLQCDPLFQDWTPFGLIEALHTMIVPGAEYDVEVFDEIDPSVPSPDWAPITLTTSRWGDLVGPFDVASHSWGPPNGSVDIVDDLVAMMDAFGTQPGGPRKVRSDVEPAVPDGVINVTDWVQMVEAFGGAVYPFAPESWPCP